MKAKVKTWLRNVDNGNIRNFTEKVLKEIKENSPNEIQSDLWKETRNGISTYELRKCLGMSHQTLTSRLSELHDHGLIRVVGQVEIQESYYSIYMYISDLKYRSHIVTLRESEKFSKWLKSAKKYEHLISKQLALSINLESLHKREGLIFEKIDL